MAEQHPPSGLERAAERAASAEYGGYYMAAALAAYRRLEGLDDAALAAVLGCTPEALAWLALCRRPRGDAPEFRRDVARIASYAGASAPALAALLRRVEAVEALAGAEGSAGRGDLLAARERPDPYVTDEGSDGDLAAGGED